MEGGTQKDALVHPCGPRQSAPAARPAQGADPGKLARQIAKRGKSLDGMPPVQVIRGKDGHLRINDGVTRVPAPRSSDQVCLCPPKSSKTCRDST